MSTQPLTITLLTGPDPRDPGKRVPRVHVVTLPGYADRLDLVLAYAKASGKKASGLAMARVRAAAVGLCTRLGRESEVDFGGCDCHVLTYGGRMLEWLTEQGADLAAMGEAGEAIMAQVIASMPPTKKEVAAAEGNSGAGEAPST